METLRMNLGVNSYDIVVGEALLENIENYLDLDRKVLIITDDGVPNKYEELLANKCKEYRTYRFKQGEASKNLDTWQAALKVATDFKMTRKDVVVAVGGGVVGDLAGFVASAYMRGVDFYNIPTTLLSQIDSSIGGKVAVDFYGMKNIVGAFWQPKKVLIDINTLNTLDKRQINNGLAEAIKTAMISDEEFFKVFEEKDVRENLEEIIIRCLNFKKKVVEEDEKETGLRKILNFGHTIGHGVETYLNGELLHGECVAIGMSKIVTVSSIKERLLKVLDKYNLPIDAQYKKEEVIEIISHDKKSSSSAIDAVYVEEIGKPEIRKTELKELEVLL